MRMAEKSMVFARIRGGVPVLSRPIRRWSCSPRAVERAFDGKSPALPPGIAVRVGAAVRQIARQVGLQAAALRRLPQDVLERAAERIMKETPRVYRVVYDLSAVPPAHVEWE